MHHAAPRGQTYASERSQELTLQAYLVQNHRQVELLGQVELRLKKHTLNPDRRAMLLVEANFTNRPRPER